MDEDEPSFLEMENPITDEANTTVDNAQKDANLNGLLKDMKSFKEFRDAVEGSLYRMEVIIANSSVQKPSLLSDNGIEASSDFVVDFLKERIVFLENELKQKDTTINFLTKKLIGDDCQVASKNFTVNVL